MTDNVNTDPTKTCGTCAFFVIFADNPKKGHCRRYPPDTDACTSVTWIDDWCGEYRGQEGL